MTPEISLLKKLKKYTVVSEWSEKNLPLTPDDITFGSNKKVWWKGTCGHEYLNEEERSRVIQSLIELNRSRKI